MIKSLKLPGSPPSSGEERGWDWVNNQSMMLTWWSLHRNPWTPRVGELLGLWTHPRAGRVVRSAQDPSGLHPMCLFIRQFMCVLYFSKILFLERWEKREKERERNIDVWEIHQLVASHTPPTRDPACNAGVCPDWELNQRPFGLQTGTQSTEPHQPGHYFRY